MNARDMFEGMLVTPTRGHRERQPGRIETIENGRALVAWTEPGGDVDWPAEWFAAGDLRSRER